MCNEVLDSLDAGEATSVETKTMTVDLNRIVDFIRTINFINSVDFIFFY